MKWQEGAAIAGSLLKGDLGGALKVPLQAKQARKRDAAIAKSGASKGAVYYDYFSKDNDGPV